MTPWLDALPYGVRVTLVAIGVVIAVLIVLGYAYVVMNAEEEPEVKGLHPNERWRIRR